jgi:hypothetical protein
LSKERNRVGKKAVASGAGTVEDESEEKFKNRKIAHVADKRARIMADVASGGGLFASLCQGKRRGVRAHQHSPGRFCEPIQQQVHQQPTT